MKLKNLVLGVALVSLSSAALAGLPGVPEVTTIIGSVADTVNSVFHSVLEIVKTINGSV